MSYIVLPIVRRADEKLTLIPCRAKKKVLKKVFSACGAVAMRATEAEKAAEMKKATADPAGLASLREQSAAASKATGTTASLAGPVAGGGASASASSVEAKGAETEPAMAQGLDVVPPVVEKERGAAGGSGSPAKMKERRTKAAREPARPSEPDAPAKEALSTEAVVRGDEVHEPRRPPLSTLSFTELHVALSEVHVVSVAWLVVRFPQSPRVDLG
jgi:hypothetical protein